jgi:hypothetical protein
MPRLAAMMSTKRNTVAKYRNAGSTESFTTSMYGSCVYSAIRNAPAPMIGGMICPPVDAAASMPPASSGLYPSFFMSGMVKAPDVTTFAIALPEMDPMKPDATTAALAGPPRCRPAAA